MNDPQTEADRRAQQCIIGNLSKNFPKITVIGEEDQAQQANVDMVAFEADHEVLKLNCPDDLRDIKEEDVNPLFSLDLN